MPETFREPLDERAGRLDRGVTRHAPIGNQRVVVPERVAIGAPVDAERPARERFARIPFPLSVVQHAARCETRLEAQQQCFGKAALCRRHRREIPFGVVRLVDRDERGLATLREPHVGGDELRIDALAQRIDRGPLHVGIRARDAGILVNARNAHLEAELHVREIGETGNRRGAAGARGARQRNMSFAGQQPGRRIEPDPTCTGNVGLGPCVQVGEIAIRAGRSFERLHVGHELDQVAGREARGNPQVAQDLDEKPARIAARAAGLVERLLGRLHAGFHSNEVRDVILHALVHGDQQIHGRQARCGGRAKVLDPCGKARACGRDFEERRQLLLERRRIRERERLGVGLDEEIERVDDRQVRGEIDRDRRGDRCGPGRPTRAIQLPYGSCCQLTKCCAGSMRSE